ncbi:uncharacterized protein HD556DRAFT_1308155 [Suillus plorans]|uniref:Uncharacterized protein n=1 Tax=Suillus plorans TaxID=116603 RepID=A0A9P7AQV4_9AGAM|nr:uncharacterized protein HD556DRAFT_1308155 [Suillus plorans]KAG1794457.1 hypothetical protein HD556DRAFT_1308155 [Suillus plorans]
MPEVTGNIEGESGSDSDQPEYGLGFKLMELVVDGTRSCSEYYPSDRVQCWTSESVALGISQTSTFLPAAQLTVDSEVNGWSLRHEVKILLPVVRRVHDYLKTATDMAEKCISSSGNFSCAPPTTEGIADNHISKASRPSVELGVLDWTIILAGIGVGGQHLRRTWLDNDEIRLLTRGRNAMARPSIPAGRGAKPGQAPQVQLCGLYRSAYIIGSQDLDGPQKREAKAMHRRTRSSSNCMTNLLYELMIFRLSYPGVLGSTMHRIAPVTSANSHTSLEDSAEHRGLEIIWI